jgi:hypothetical protein
MPTQSDSTKSNKKSLPSIRAGLGRIDRQYGVIALQNAIRLAATRKAYCIRVGSEWSIEDEEGRLELVRRFSVAMCAYHRAHTMMRVHRLQPGTAPIRPVSLGDDEDVILATLKDRMMESTGRESSKKRKAKDWLASFGSWRNRVMIYEAEIAAKVVVLLSILMHAGIAGDDDLAFEIRAFVSKHYGKDIVGYPESYPEIHRLAQVLSRRHDVISDALLPKSGGRTGKSRDRWAADRCDEPEQMNVFENS